jgi:ribulose-bisphosphate carboxylase large chain
MSHRALLGQVMRLAGADAVIFPSFGGRFSFTQTECRGIVGGTTAKMGHVRPILPAPAGGMRLDRVPELRAFYGDDVVFLIGGDLHQGPNLVDSCRRFRSLVES